MKRFFYFLVLILLISQSCKVGKYGSWVNDNIDPGVVKDIKTIDENVLIAAKENNISVFNSICSEELLEMSGGDMPEIISTLSEYVTNTEYEILDQYYVKNTKSGLSNTMVSGVDGLNDYIIHYKALNEEMFISLLVVASGIDKILITNIYGMYPEGWKLNILQFGQYTIDGKTAPELYHEAKKKHKKGFLVDAVLDMTSCSMISNPSNQFWQYQNEKEMKSYYQEITEEFNSLYSFPFTLENIETTPQILGLNTQGIDEGYFTLVNYLTNVDLDDIENLEIENTKIHTELGNVFKGINNSKKYTFYKAWNKIPEGGNPEPNYGFVKENE